MTHSFKDYVKIIKIVMVNFNVTIFSRLKLTVKFINEW